MSVDQATVKPQTRSRGKWTGKGQVIEMTVDFLGAAIAAFLFIGPFVALAVAAITFGVDSRPGIDDRGPRRWMVGG
jgi:hypothetical protein